MKFALVLLILGSVLSRIAAYASTNPARGGVSIEG